MGKIFRTIRISDKLVTSCKKFLHTKKAEKLGLETIKDVIEYSPRKGMDNN